jgi:predicted permease
MARRKLGNVTRVSEDVHEVNSLRWLEWFWRDLRYAGRLCRRSPAFAAAAITSLALAIGANTVVFGVVNALMVKPLPVEAPEQLVFVQSAIAGAGSHSFPNYRDFRDRNRTLAGLIGYRISPMNVEIGGAATRVWGYLATGNYFQLLGVTAAAGRLFVQDDDREPGAAPLAVLSYDTWQRRFFGDPAVVGQTIRINRLPFTIVGVAPRGFHGTEVFYRPEIWVPMMMQAQIEVGNPWLEARQTHNTWVLGRLADGASAAQAEGDLNAIAADLRATYPGVNRNLQVRLTQPGLVGDALRAPMQAFTLGLFMLSGLVLLVGCANLASILLAHGVDRQREIALRVSIGAGRARLLQQLLTESMLLSLIGGAAGATLAAAASAALSTWRLPLELPVQFDVQTDARVLLFGIAASVAAGVAFGVAPARQASRVDPNAALKGVTNGKTRGRWHWPLRDALVAVQVAFCVVLLSACLLSVKGLQQALIMRTGFDPEGVSVAGFELGLAGYGEERGREFQEEVVQALSRLPGILSVAYANSLPLSADQSSTTVSSELEPRATAAGVRVTYYQVSPGLFATLGTRLVAGREFDSRDRQGAPAAAIVNETFVRRVLQSAQGVGKRFRYGQADQLVEVVGVVEDGKYTSLSEAPRPVIFQPILQRYNSTTMVVVRSRLTEEQVAGEIRRAIAALDSELPVYSAGTLTQFLRLAWLPSRVAAVALTAFGVLGLVLSATGIHGLVAYAVARRQKEIGIRMAVGAGRGAILKLVLARVAASIFTGAVIGLVLAFAAGSVLANIIYLASPRDLGVTVAVVLVLVAAGAASCWLPLRRALRTDPMHAVRME